MVDKIKAWSFSRYNDYKKCPRMAMHKHVQRIKEPSNAAMDRGNAIGELCDKYIRREIDRRPPELKKFGRDFDGLRVGAHGVPQLQLELAVTSTWAPCAWDAWSTAWLRARLDAMTIEGDTATIIDFKTGKERPENLAQLDLYALMGFIHYPLIKTVHTALWYLDSGARPEKTYVRGELPELKKKWKGETRKMLGDTKFDPTPSHACSWCWFGASGKKKGGPGLCPH